MICVDEAVQGCEVEVVLHEAFLSVADRAVSEAVPCEVAAATEVAVFLQDHRAQAHTQFPQLNHVEHRLNVEDSITEVALVP